MQTITCTVNLGGDRGNSVVKHDVTAAEAQLLLTIHGGQGIEDARRGKPIERTPRDEFERLRLTYGRAQSGSGANIFSRLYPTRAAMPVSFDQVDMEPHVWAPEERAALAVADDTAAANEAIRAAQERAAALQRKQDAYNSLTLTKLRALAKARGVQALGATKEDTVAALILADEVLGDEGGAPEADDAETDAPDGDETDASVDTPSDMG